MARQAFEIDGRTLSLSNLDKVLYPEAGFTKGQVIDYYTRIAETMLPHLHDRPVTLKRYPDGVEGPSFYEKNCPSHRPEWVEIAGVKPSDTSDPVHHCLIQEQATLVWAANLAALELHTSLATAAHYQQPTMVAFDLDPGPPATLELCLEIGLELRDLLEQLGLTCLAKTSGGKGLHIYVPLNTRTTYEKTKPFARAVADLMVRRDPDRTVANMRKALRTGKVLIDWSQNSRHKTTVCAYSLRARNRPTVSAPVTWDEIKRAHKQKKPERLIFEAPAMLKRVEKQGDLFAEALTLKQKLPALDREAGAG